MNIIDMAKLCHRESGLWHSLSYHVSGILPHLSGANLNMSN